MEKNIIKNFSFTRLIRISTFTLVSLSLFFSLQSDTLYLDNLSGNFILLLFITIFLIALIILFNVELKKKFLITLRFLSKNKKTIFWLLFFCGVIYQLFLFSFLRGYPRFDAAYLVFNIYDKDAMSAYVSQNSNNTFIYFFNLFIFKIFGHSVFILQVTHAIFLFLAVLIFKRICFILFNETTSYLATLIFMFFAIIQPVYLTAYTDSLCILPMFISIYFMTIWYKSRNLATLKMQTVLPIISAIFVVVTYLIRPSAIIFLFAVLMYLFVSFKKINYKKLFCYQVGLFFITIIAAIFIFNIFLSKQNNVKIDHSQELPSSIFLLYGSYGDENNHNSRHGTWNVYDAEISNSNNTKSMKSKLAIERLKIRTKHRGLARTIKLYTQKYIQNTDTGVVGYHRDGLWVSPEHSSENSFRNRVEQLYAEGGKLRASFNFICQIIWICILIAVLVGLILNNSIEMSVVSLSLILGLLFLEIFESGGTKYLFQYTPLISLLAGVGFAKILNICRMKLSFEK